MKNQDRKAFNSSLRPVAKKKIGLPKKPASKPTLDEVKKRFEVVFAAMLGEKPRKPMKKRSSSNEGWIDVAQGMWKDPNNDRCCEVCGCYLGDEFSPNFYHHLLHRGSYRKMKRRPENLAQICQADHDRAHKYGLENMAEEGMNNAKGWMLLATRMVSLRNEANGINDTGRG